jgi:hypothetical protein
MNLIAFAIDAIIRKYLGNSNGITSNIKLSEMPVILIILQLLAFFSIDCKYFVVNRIPPNYLSM